MGFVTSNVEQLCIARFMFWTPECEGLSYTVSDINNFFSVDSSPSGDFCFRIFGNRQDISSTMARWLYHELIVSALQRI